MRIGSRRPHAWAIAGALAVAAAAPGLSQERQIVVRSHQPVRPHLSYVKLAGALPDGRTFRITASESSRDRSITVSARIGGKSMRPIHLAHDRYSDVDLRTAAVELGRDGHVSVNLQFGPERRECFQNHNGRDMMLVTFLSETRGRLDVMSYAECEPRVTSVEVS